MAYDPEIIYKEALAATEEEHVYFIEDVAALVSCGRSVFWSMFPAGSDKMDNIKEKLNHNKIVQKKKLRKILSKGTKAAEVISLYKLIATDAERQALSQSHVDHTTKGEKVAPPVTWAAPDKD